VISSSVSPPPSPAPVASLDASAAATPPMPRGMTAAHRTGSQPALPRASQVILGEGWGCAAFRFEAGQQWQCWDAGPSPTAWSVPWLESKSLQSGPDRICELARPALTFRCWRRPARGEASGEELHSSWEWLNPHQTHWDDAFSRSDRVGESFVGGTFACLKATMGESVWCLGDDGFGQLGGSKPAPAANAPRNDRAFVQGLWPAEAPAVGTWHGCAIAAPDGLANGAYVACWGRGDHGQLGAPGPDVCRGIGGPVACAHTPQKGPAVDPMAALALGDLFTCVTTRQGLSCWGASRDGFFGTPGSCPDSLKSEWPTLHGPVQAPRAACSSSPVAVQGMSGFEPNLASGPRGVCADEPSAGRPRCVGGVPTPQGRGITGVVVSPGADASACGLRDGGVVCWGEGYSPAAAPDSPVPVAFEAQPPVGERAAVGATDPAGWESGCLVRQGCTLPVKPVLACATIPAGLHDVDALATSSALSGQNVSLRGVLGVGAMLHTMMDCGADRACCNHVGGPVVLGGSSGAAVALSGFFCTGDDSAACCNAPAYGQTVVATGHLEPNSRGMGPRWILTGATMCAAP
jgi:hypothetical protein